LRRDEVGRFFLKKSVYSESFPNFKSDHIATESRISDMQFLLQATIMRPAAMVGTEDRLLNQWARFAKKYGFLTLIGDGSTKYVLNLSFAIWCCNYVILKF
jgi:NADH dehydrogenase (ubiquinone) 1 alpha subcomplex subunit 9